MGNGYSVTVALTDTAREVQKGSIFLAVNPVISCVSLHIATDFSKISQNTTQVSHKHVTH